MLTFLKLGGSLITDKSTEQTYLGERVEAIAHAIHDAQMAKGQCHLLVGHGSGSFGHFPAREYDTVHGVYTEQQWQGFAEVARVAGKLNVLVAATMAEAGLPVWPISPSASVECVDGEINDIEVRPLHVALDNGLIPLVHGDVAVDTMQGGTIVSTEQVFFHLTPLLLPERIILLGDMPGVLDGEGKVIPRITPRNFDSVKDMLGGSSGVDVTGGMLSKVEIMLALVSAQPRLSIRIASGLEREAVTTMLVDRKSTLGTVIAVS